jgi:hypothetical protein
MKLILSTIVVGVVLFLLGGLFFNFLFVDYFKVNFGSIMRGEHDLKLWAFAAGSVARALFLYIIYSKGYKGGSPFMEGFRFGVWMSLFFSIPYVLFMWGSTPVKYQPVILDGIINMVMIIIAGILTGIIHGRKSVSQTAA